MQHYLISPDVHGEKISFLWDNDLWIIPEKNAVPVRLTSGLGVVTDSRFSPDGKYITFRVEAEQDGSAADIYSIRLSDGNLTRITYLSGKSVSRRMFTSVAGYTPDDRIIISTDAYTPFAAMTDLYSISLEGGPLVPLNLGPAISVLYSGKNVIITRHTIDMPHWKGYKGGTSGVMWKSTNGGPFEKFLDIGHHVTSPMAVGNRIFFVTDKDGTGNVYSVDINGGSIKRHTFFNEFHVRNAKTDGEAIVFQMAGEIYWMRPDGEPEKVRVGVISAPGAPIEKFVKASDYLEAFSLSASGESITIISRGRAFTSGFATGPVMETGKSSEHVRLACLSGEERVVFISDREGQEDLYIRKLGDGKEIRIELNLGIIESISVSSGGNKAALSNNRGDLFLVQLEGDSVGRIRKVDHSDGDIIRDVTWSPDGALVAYTYPEASNFLGRAATSIIRLYSIEEDRCVSVTETGSRDFSPVFSREMNYLYFLSARDLDPVQDKVVFDFSFPVSVVLNTIPLNEGSSLELDGIPQGYSGEKGGKYGVDSLIERQRTLDLKASDYSRIMPVSDGVILLEFPVVGMLRYDLFSKGVKQGNLIRFHTGTQKAEEVATDVTDFQVASGSDVVVSTHRGGRVSRLELKGPSPSGYETFDMGRIRLKITPQEEWKQMFAELKRLIKENFWDESKISGEYSRLFGKYDHLVGGLSSRFELSDLMRDFQGEFRTSHSYETGGDLTYARSYPAGKLGVDLTFDGNGYTVENIISADFSNRNEKSPVYLGAAKIKKGDMILSINGSILSENTTPEQILYNHADDLVRLEVSRKGEIFNVFVRTLPDDRHLRYREWVEKNRRFVHEKTDGRVGYIHIPDMSMNGFAEFTRLYPAESAKEALIVDVRYNGGGSVSQLLLEKLSKRRIGYAKPRRGEVQPYPLYSVNGPMVAITNENAGSDGDIFTHSFKLFGLGPVVGKRSWGGVVGVNPLHKLVDGTLVTQPQFALWFKDVGYNVENHGADPTVEVDNSPSDWSEGLDRQLEKALEVIEEGLKNSDRRVDPPS